jgi:hypothetical protein
MSAYPKNACNDKQKYFSHVMMLFNKKTSKLELMQRISDEMGQGSDEIDDQTASIFLICSK